MELSLRMKEYRDYYGWTQSDLSEKSGISISTIKKYEAGAVENFTYENLKKISSAFNVSPSEFLSVNVSVNKNKNVRQLSSNSSPITNKKFADEIVKIPYFQDTYASAGTGAINYDEMPIIMELDINFIRVFLQITTSVANMHIINAKGDSMEPTIKDGELLYINPIENEGGVNSGSIYVINLNGDILVKRIDKNPITKALTLISDNSKYKPIEIKNVDLELCSVIGRVVAHTARL